MGMTTTSLNDPIPDVPKTTGYVEQTPETGIEVLEALLEEPIIRKQQFVYCTFQQEGYHCFPEAATDSKYATGDEFDVSHLANRHFHYFNFKVWVEVTHSNRSIEFIQLRRWLQSLYTSNTLELDNMSCEMISDALHKTIFARYPVNIMIDVSEEGINGSYTEYSV